MITNLIQALLLTMIILQIVLLLQMIYTKHREHKAYMSSSRLLSEVEKQLVEYVKNIDKDEELNETNENQE